jgi:hypothetical protein
MSPSDNNGTSTTQAYTADLMEDQRISNAIVYEDFEEFPKKKTKTHGNGDGCTWSALSPELHILILRFVGNGRYIGGI